MFRDSTNDLIILKELSLLTVGNCSRNLGMILLDRSLLEDLGLTGCHFGNIP